MRASRMEPTVPQGFAHPPPGDRRTEDGSIASGCHSLAHAVLEMNEIPDRAKVSPRGLRTVMRTAQAPRTGCNEPGPGETSLSVPPSITLSR